MAQQESAPPDAVPKLLRDLRAVYLNQPLRTKAQQDLKAQYDKGGPSREQFLARLERMEKEYGGWRGKDTQKPGAEEAPYEDFRNMPMSQLGPLGDELIAKAMWSPEQEREECARLAGKLMLAHGGTEDAAELVVAAIRKRAWGPNP